MRLSILRLVAAATTVLAAACSSGEPDGSPVGAAAEALILPPFRLDAGRVDLPPTALADRIFFFQTLSRRCIEVGGRERMVEHQPVVIDDCTYAASGMIRVRELDAASHDVELSAGGLCFGVRGGVVAVGASIELQICNGSMGQRFAVDGDALMMGRQTGGHVSREYVLEPDRDLTASRTPVVVGTRDLSDAEYFAHKANDGSGAGLTTGFVRVTTQAQLEAALALGWGTVIQIEGGKGPVLIGAPAADGRPTWDTAKPIRSGVTVRGYRRRTDPGPVLEYVVPPKKSDTRGLFSVQAGETDVRITGLQLRGSSDTRQAEVGNVFGINTAGTAVLVDRNEITRWTGAGVIAYGTDSTGEPFGACYEGKEYPRVPAVRVVKNFLHHNQMYGMGYGVAVYDGSFASIQGNVMYDNRHSIAGQARGTVGYEAFDNFVLSESPDYDSQDKSRTPDFDIHGARHDHPDLDWAGGVSGDYVDVGWDTFLGTDHGSFIGRGTPCRFQSVHDCSFARGAASDLHSRDGAIRSYTEDRAKLSLFANQYQAKNPTFDLAVGDFDGDGVDDVFVGTGTGWFFSSAGKTEWRFMSRKSERASDLRFGDFDKDGRTDVIAINRGTGNLDISYAGMTDWQFLNVAGTTSIADLAVGDFDDDKVPDVFRADGENWFLADRGTGAWHWFAQSTYRTKSLRFGDFTGDRKTDVFGVANGAWSIVPGGGSMWQPLGPKRTNDTNGLYVADFDGDGRPDIARFELSGIWPTDVWATWSYSPHGQDDFVFLDTISITRVDRPLVGAIGRFDDGPTADILAWNGLDLRIAKGGLGTPALWGAMHLR